MTIGAFDPPAMMVRTPTLQRMAPFAPQGACLWAPAPLLRFARQYALQAVNV